ncbi:MAG: hypothetical protein IT348_20100, partial [Candidatus Eisenbacteria bacterium]|nr:hypothetical protein [Candidatus Eisenbacteria bacterium]
PAMLLPIADAPMFIQADPLGFPGTAFQGASFYSASNPEVGAVITWFVKDDYKSLKKKRIAEEKKLQEAGKHVPFPTHEQLKREANEVEPSLLFVISDSEGRALRKIKKPVKAGVQRFVWDFRTSRFGPIELSGPSNPAPWDEPERGWMVPPGTYTVTMHLLQDGKLTPMGSPQSAKCRPLHEASIPPAEQVALRAFNEKAAALSRAISAADAHRGQLNDVLPYLEAAVMSLTTVGEDQLAELSAIKSRLKEIDEALNGDALLPKFEGQSRMSLKGRTDLIIGSLWSTTAGPTGTYERAYDEARASFGKVLADLRAVHDRTQAFETRLEQAGAPYTPGRMPVWVDAK